MSPDNTRKVIGFKLSYDLNALIPQGVENALAFRDSSVLNFGKEFSLFRHLGYDIPFSELAQIVEAGIQWTHDHFQRGSDPEDFEADGGWYTPLSRSMFLCLLSKDYDSLEQICTLCGLDRGLEYKEPLPDAVQRIYLELGNQFARSGNKKSVEEIEATLRCSDQLSLTLKDALLAIVAMDQSGFERSLENSVALKRKEKKPSPKAQFMEDWFPIHANTLYLAGLKKGLSDTKLSQDCLAYFATPESVGF